MRAKTVLSLDEQIAAFQRTAAYRIAEQELGMVAVCLIGHRTRVPRYIGDNRGDRPVRVGVSRDPKNAYKADDLRQPHHEMVVLRYVWTRSEADAARLKKELDLALLGDGEARLRHGYRDIDADDDDDLELRWSLIIGSAMREIEQRGERIEVFGEREKVFRILARARERVGKK